MMGFILSILFALNPRFKELKFLSKEEKETVWKQLKK